MKDERGYDLFLLFNQGWTTKELIKSLEFPPWLVYRWHQKYKDAQNRVKRRMLALKATHLGK